MKKNYLSILGFILSVNLVAQTNVQESGAVKGDNSKMITSQYEQITTNTSTAAHDPNMNASIRRSNTVIVVGQTKYDLQTNSSVARRVILHSDGTVSMVYTNSNEETFTDRGTGYQYITKANGEWFNASPLVKTKLETVRTGWPNIGVLSNGNEFTLGHIAADGGWARAENTGKGTAFVQTDASVNDDGIHKPIWGRMANVGDIVYLLGNYTDSAKAGEPRYPTRKGIIAPMTYSKSIDGGKTWVISNILLPGYDSVRYNRGGGDQYSIDARDSIVAICQTDLAEDLAIWKSTDYGVTFTKTIVDSIAIPNIQDSMFLPQTRTHDGSSTVVIDKNGMVHIAWGVSYFQNTDTLDGVNFSFFPGSASLGYWNEITKTQQFIVDSLAMDLNGDNAYNFAVENFQSLGTGSTLPNGLTTVARYGSTSVITMPSLGLDTAGGVYISFSALVEDDLDEVHNINVRDAFLVYSADNGANWGKPLNISQAKRKEVAFPTIAKDVNEFVHFQFQIDILPGTNLQNNATGIDNHPVVVNDICYMAVPVAQIKLASIEGSAVSVENIAESKVFVAGQNQPNPFRGTTDVTVYLTNPSALKVMITNVAGQVVKNYLTQELNSGNHIVTIDGSDLQAGVYMYTMTASNGESTTKKMVVK